MFKELTTLANVIADDNAAKGFWESFEVINNGETGAISPLEVRDMYIAQKLALMHSELSEALEADRKKLKDDKLPQYDGLHVELADCLIRILDFCGMFNVDIGAITEAKLAYNKSRAYKHGKGY